MRNTSYSARSKVFGQGLNAVTFSYRRGLLNEADADSLIRAFVGAKLAGDLNDLAAEALSPDKIRRSLRPARPRRARFLGVF